MLKVLKAGCPIFFSCIGRHTISGGLESRLLCLHRASWFTMFYATPNKTNPVALDRTGRLRAEPSLRRTVLDAPHSPLKGCSLCTKHRLRRVQFLGVEPETLITVCASPMIKRIQTCSFFFFFCVCVCVGALTIAACRPCPLRAKAWHSWCSSWCGPVLSHDPHLLR